MTDDLQRDVGTPSGAPAAAALPPGAAPMSAQLTQVRVPLVEAAEALATPDEAGRLPIVLLPRTAFRIQNGLVAAGLLAFVVGLVFDLQLALRGGLLGIGVVLVILGVFRSFLVPVPEGSQAVLLRRGRFDRTLGPGNHVIPPWIIVSHLVTTREIPFDAPATEVPTSDDVRTNVDILLTFRIDAPERFVFTISAPDFDLVCQAACQDAIRLLVRGKDSDRILDLGQADAEQLRSVIGSALEPYGATVVRVVVTHVRPPLDFMLSRESRRLAAVQRAEEEERHALDVRRQADREDLERQRITARRSALELEAENEVARLERLETRLKDYPNAMRWDVGGQRLEIARALAANTRAMVQIGPGADVAASLLLHTVAETGDEPASVRPPEGPGAAAPPQRRPRRTAG